MHTLEYSDKNRLPLNMDDAIGVSFPCDPEVALAIGTLVKLNSDGKVSPCTGSLVNNIPIGYVTVPNVNDKSQVTVDILCIAKTQGTAGGNISVGDLVMISDGQNVFVSAQDQNYAVGVALTEAVEDDTLWVGIFYTPLWFVD